MNQAVQSADDFCWISPAKVFALSIATCGLYLLYWYEMQYAKSKKVPRRAFIDFLKSYFFVIFSFQLSEKINSLIGNHSYKMRITHRVYFASKFLLVLALETIFYTLYSIHVFLLAFLIIESAYACMLQTVINEKLPQREFLYPWQRFDFFHLIVLVGGLAIVLFFQFSDNPFAYFRK